MLARAAWETDLGRGPEGSPKPFRFPMPEGVFESGNAKRRGTAPRDGNNRRFDRWRAASRGATGYGGRALAGVTVLVAHRSPARTRGTPCLTAEGERLYWALRTGSWGRR